MLVNLERDKREIAAGWVTKKIDGTLPELYESLVFKTSNKLGAAVFYNYDGHNVDVNIASDSPLIWNRSNLKIGFRYAFDQLKVERMTAVIKKNNVRCVKLAEFTGFKLEGVIRKGARDGDLCIYGLLKDEYLKGKFYGPVIAP